MTEPVRMKMVGFEVTEEEWKGLKKKCLETGNNLRTLFRPYVTLLLKGKEVPKDTSNVQAGK